MRWFFLILIIINIAVISLVFRSNLNAPKPNALKPQQSAAFPSSLVMIDELESLPTEITHTPIATASNSNINPGNRQSNSSSLTNENGAVFNAIVSYSELDLLEDIPLDEQAEELKTEAYQPSGLSRVCINLTNLEKDDDMTAIIDTLGKSKINPEVYSEDAPFYWVYIPPANIRNNVKQTILAIRDLNLDAHLLKDGLYRGGISTGVFVNERNATRYASRLRDLGFEANIEQRERKKYRIFIGRKDVRVFNNEVFENIRRQFNFVKIEENPC